MGRDLLINYKEEEYARDFNHGYDGGMLKECSSLLTHSP